MATGNYDVVARVWQGAGPHLPPSPQEAIAGARLLMRAFHSKTWDRPIKATTGNRHTWTRRGVLYVNPVYTWNPGWRGIVHDLSHLIHSRQSSRPAHDSTHTVLERRMAEYVVERGWHQGKLLPKPRPKKERPPVDKNQVELAKALAAMKRWETKKKRAETALKKLKRRVGYYQRAVAKATPATPALEEGRMTEPTRDPTRYRVTLICRCNQDATFGYGATPEEARKVAHYHFRKHNGRAKVKEGILEHAVVHNASGGSHYEEVRS